MTDEAVPLVQDDDLSSTTSSTSTSSISRASSYSYDEQDDSKKRWIRSSSSFSNDDGSWWSSCLPTTSSTYSLKSVLLVLLAIQGSSAIVLGRYTRFSVPEDELYQISHLVLVIESVKLVLSLLAETIFTRGHVLDSLHQHVWQRPLDSIKVLVPAMLYVIQNSLVYIALSNLSAPVFISLQQGKLIATAMVSVVMLQRSYTIQQWTCLIVLAIGVAIIALDEHHQHSASNSSSNGQQATSDEQQQLQEEDAMQQHPEQFFVVGLIAVTGACFSSAFAGVYFEKVLSPEKAARSPTSMLLEEEEKSLQVYTPSKPTTTTSPVVLPSLWIRNLQLAFFSILCCMAQGAWESRTLLPPSSVADTDGDAVEEQEKVSSKSFFAGFTTWVWVLVFIQAFGGLLVAAVMKWADNVLKGLAMGVAVVIASLASTLAFQVQLSMQFVLGAAIICCSVYCFSNDAQCLSVCCKSNNSTDNNNNRDMTDA